MQSRIVQHLQLGGKDVAGVFAGDGGRFHAADFQSRRDRVDGRLKARVFLVRFNSGNDRARNSVTIRIQH
jgi:hypothetical protein